MAATVPVEYNASLESIRIPTPTLKPKSAQRSARDPLSEFDSFHTQVRADLYNWMTFCEADRIKKVQDILRNWALAAKWDGVAVEPPSEAQRAFYWMDDRKLSSESAVVKILNFIIWHERMQESGSREVARIAFLGLFPKDKEK